jgi:hypothetical protein
MLDVTPVEEVCQYYDKPLIPYRRFNVIECPESKDLTVFRSEGGWSMTFPRSEYSLLLLTELEECLRQVRLEITDSL